jgi:hypothetical protein
MKTSSNQSPLANELRALIAATPLAVFLRAVRGDISTRAARATRTTGMRASA